MQQDYTSKAFVLAVLMASAVTMQAQNSWAMATIENGNNWPSFTEFHCEPEKGANGSDYHRIYDWSLRIRQEYHNPVKLQYGYRMSGKQIFIYDFDKDEERLAFDFTLTAGDHFITYNGTEWEVDAAMDTLVNISYLAQGENSTKRLLKVHSVDGRYSDQWLEDFGSFANHFMILPIYETGQAQTLWMEYDKGCYLVREISSDPLFTHDSGKPQHTYDDIDDDRPITNITYDGGTLIVEDERWHSPNREYSCFYRVGDDFYRAYVWELNPATNASYVVWHKDTAYYYGLPVPQSGEYTIHFNDDRPTGNNTNNVDSPNVTTRNLTGLPFHDLQGRKQTSKPTKGIYIHQGKKYMR